MGVSPLNTEQLAKSYGSKHPEEIIRFALDMCSEVAISFSGAEDVVLIDLATRIVKDVAVFSLDTGRLHPDTYRFIDQVRDHYGIAIELLSPDTERLEKFVKEKGLYSFHRDGHKECCAIRKVEPLNRKLANLDAWITGQRRDQSMGTRTHVPVIEDDHSFSGPKRKLIKFNPLAGWNSVDVWNYIRENDLPYNPLHGQGYISIGCEPCTRPVLPNQHEREGRWWWERSVDKECGLHEGYNRKSA